MRLDRLWISEFKNLRDFSIQFDDTSSFAVLVGRNGSGKSNLIEALVVIFRNLDLGDAPPFDYELVYKRSTADRPETIKITAEKESQRFFINDTEVSRAGFYSYKDEYPSYLPRFVFGYYSGPSDRLATYFRRHQERFYTKLKDPKANSQQIPLRTLFLAENVHGQFVLLAFYSHADVEAQAFLKDQLRIVDLEFVRFVINRPEWAKKGTEDRFWGTTGIPRTLLEQLESLSLATTKTKRKVELTFRRSTTLDCWNFLLDKAAFQRMAKSYSSAQDLFKVLESAHISDLLFELVVQVKVQSVDGSISFRELSEGEQQLLLVLGLLRFTHEDETLFLLDEPDTHLNPAWSVQYLRFIEDMVGEQHTSHVVMATHDPLVFGGLSKDQVRIMNLSETGRVVASKPEEDPRGMGLDAILTSDLFGLRAALDLPTLSEMDRRRHLLVKPAKTQDDLQELRQLNSKLADLDYAIDNTDPLFSLFVQEMTRWQEEHGLVKTVLSTQERELQREKAREIVDKLRRQTPEQ